MHDEEEQKKYFYPNECVTHVFSNQKIEKNYFSFFGKMKIEENGNRIKIMCVMGKIKQGEGNFEEL